MAKSPRCPKCKMMSGDDWSQCGGSCPMPMSPHYRVKMVEVARIEPATAALQVQHANLGHAPPFRLKAMEQRDFEKLCWLVAITTAMDHYQELLAGDKKTVLDDVKQMKSNMSSVDFDRLLRDARKYELNMGLTSKEVDQLLK